MSFRSGCAAFLHKANLGFRLKKIKSPQLTNQNKRMRPGSRIFLRETKQLSHISKGTAVALAFAKARINQIILTVPCQIY